MSENQKRTAAEIVDLALRPKPELPVYESNLPATAEALRDLLAASGRLFDRGIPVRVVSQADSQFPRAIPLTKNNVVMQAHQLCQPIKIKDGTAKPITLPDRVALMYLDLVGEWGLPPLDGISASPLLSPDGALQTISGYDSRSRLWCCGAPALSVPVQPTRGDAVGALRLIRETFRTFPFADSVRIPDTEGKLELVDLTKPPGRDESAFLVALLTACCRPSLLLAPGLVLSAPTISGAGCGKGLLVHAICLIAFGCAPRAFPPGHNRDELDKRLAAEFVDARPAVFLDNANGRALQSDTLASVMTERPAGVRILGETRMVQLNSTAFVAVTGNGLSVSEDLARRFVICELDARCEDPESRPFEEGFLLEVERRRPELLSAVLTIWRWGRQNLATIPKGKPLGSFETWARWCRDPLLALGCRDPVERIEALKARDPKRLHVVEVFTAWWEHHGDKPIGIKELADPVRMLVDAHNKGRQHVVSTIGGMVGTNAGGFVLTSQSGPGRWSRTSYQLKQIGGVEGAGHRGHRGHRGAETDPGASDAPISTVTAPKTPMTPMPHEVDGDAIPPGEEAEL